METNQRLFLIWKLKEFKFSPEVLVNVSWIFLHVMILSSRKKMIWVYVSGFRAEKIHLKVLLTQTAVNKKM